MGWADNNKTRSGHVSYPDEGHVMKCEGRRPRERPRAGEQSRGVSKVGVVRTVMSGDPQQLRSWVLGSFCHVGLVPEQPQDAGGIFRSHDFLVL